MLKKIKEIWYAVALGDDKRIVACNFSKNGRVNAVTNVLSTLPEGATIIEEEH